MAATVREARETQVSPAAVNITVNLPASTADGDYVLISLLTNGGTITSPSSPWVVHDTEYVQANPKHAVFGKFWNTGDPTTLTVTVTSVTKTALALALAGVDPTTPIDVVSTGGTNSTGSNTIQAASMVTTVADTLIILFGGINSSSNALGPGASGMTEVIEAAGVKKQAAYSETRAATGATGTRTVAAVSNTLAWTAIMLALRPYVPLPVRRRSLIATH